MNIMRYAAGFTELRVTGAEPERFLTALAEKGVPFWDASPPEAFSLTLRVPARRAGQALALAAAEGCEAEKVSVRGAPWLWRRALGRPVLAAALLLTALALTWSMSRIWDIRLEGNETIPDGIILQALEDCGVYIGADWTGMSQDAVRNGVILRVPGIRWMTVTMNGSRARVIIRERRERIDPVDEDEYVKLVADRAGLVTEVRALQGTAETEPGRACLPGDVLIGGYTTGRFGVLGPVHAVGGVTARTWYELTAAALSDVAVKAPAGERRTLYSLILGKIRINFYKGSSICPAGCDKIIEELSLSRAGVFTLPVTVERATLTRYDAETQPGAELREELEAELMAALEERVGDGGEIVSASFTASEADGVLYVTLRAECLEQIGVEVPLTAEEIQEIKGKIPTTEDSNT